MRFAYADPPYPGTAKRRYNQPEVDHRELMLRLSGFDGWALHSNPQGLSELAPLFPQSRILAWCKHDALPVAKTGLVWSWEPIILHPLRAPSIWVRDSLWIDATERNGAVVVGATPGDSGRGWKPPGLLRWVFQAAGLQANDILEDLFPGSGAVTRAWDAFRSQLPLPL